MMNRRIPWTIISIVALILPHVIEASLRQSLLRKVAILRGGSTTTTTIHKKKKPTQDVKAYRLQQQLYLQSRSLQLRQALIARGMEELQHSVSETTRAVPVDWDCALSSSTNPKSCLFSFDAEPGSKVIAPINTSQWITLSSLNRLRRNDPTKVEPLWHSQYLILSQWFSPNSSYSLYTHLSPLATALSLLLDAPVGLAALVLGVAAIGFLLTLPLWESLLQTFLTSKYLWLQWPQWGRFIHAALPLKLLLGQMVWKALAGLFNSIYQTVRTQLVEWECQMLEKCTPLTILEENEAIANNRVADFEEELMNTDDDDDDE